VRGLSTIAFVVILGCGGAVRSPSPAPHYDEPFFTRKPLASYAIPTPRPGRPSDTVVGDVRKVTVRDGDTLLDLARLYDLGFDELQEANPGVDPWVPPVGSSVVLPTAFVLPCCSYDGLVINVPEMRLYFYRPGSRPGTTIVETFPLGLGRAEYRTPTGVFHVKGKTVNPGWGVPESIRAEHIRERGDPRAFIRGGDPDNPLGKYRLELDRTLYRIHGTNFPWGIGRLVSHGCAQLYPEDVAHLFPLVPVGTRVEFVYQPVKVGRRDGATFVESHPDVYRRSGPPYDQAVAALRAQGLTADSSRLRAALRDGNGVPQVVESGSWWGWVKTTL
jgi:L,D-transpeptidase ErfK/SrfK